MIAPKSRLHIHSHKRPGDTAYIIGDKSALRSLAHALLAAANGVVGLEKLTLYTSDGHAYDMVVSADIAEEEWQSAPPSYEKNSDPRSFESIKTYEEFFAKKT